MPGHDRRRTRPPEHQSLAEKRLGGKGPFVKKGYTQNPLAAAKARAAAADVLNPKPAKQVVSIEGANEGTIEVNADGVPSVAEVKTPKVSEPQRDSTGQLYITLAQALKKYSLAATGGEAKHLVRAGGITINGTPEERPGRKLHAGDVVVVGDSTVTIDKME